MSITLEEIRKQAPNGATGYLKDKDGNIDYIRKTPKRYYYQNFKGGRWWKVPEIDVDDIDSNYKPL